MNFVRNYIDAAAKEAKPNNDMFMTKLVKFILRLK